MGVPTYPGTVLTLGGAAHRFISLTGSYRPVDIKGVAPIIGKKPGRETMPHRRIQQVLRNQHLLHLGPTVTVREAARKMSERHVAAVLVTESDDTLEGIFTERDLLDRVVVPGLDPDTTPLSKVMTPRPATVAPGETVRDALAIMDAKGVRHLPVAVEGRVLGVVSMRDFVGDEVAVLDRQHEIETQYAEHMR